MFMTIVTRSMAKRRRSNDESQSVSSDSGNSDKDDKGKYALIISVSDVTEAERMALQISIAHPAHTVVVARLMGGDAADPSPGDTPDSAHDGEEDNDVDFDDDDDDDDGDDGMKPRFFSASNAAMSESTFLRKAPRDLRRRIKAAEKALREAVSGERPGSDSGGYHENMPMPAKFQVLLRSGMTDDTKRTILSNIERRDAMSPMDSERSKLSGWIQAATGIPYGRYLPVCLDPSAGPERFREHFARVREHMDAVVTGHDETKSAIIRLAAQWIVGGVSGKVIGIQGPPGIGKTRLITEGLGRALFGFDYDETRVRPVHVICVGNASEGFLDGFQYTFTGSTHGEMVRCLTRAGIMNPIVCLDEVDKIDTGRGGGGGEASPASSALIHMLDPVTHHRWRDRFLDGVDIDLSRVTFMCSFNDPRAVSPILMDRMAVIRMKGYSSKEKVTIAERHLVPRAVQSFGMEPGSVRFERETLARLVALSSPEESGVRDVIRAIEFVLGEINVWAMSGGGSVPAVIDADAISEAGIDLRTLTPKTSSLPPPGMYT